MKIRPISRDVPFYWDADTRQWDTPPPIGPGERRVADSTNDATATNPATAGLLDAGDRWRYPAGGGPYV